MTTMVATSPQCIIQETKRCYTASIYHPGVANEPHRKGVRFSTSPPEEIASNIDDDEVDALWISREECRNLRSSAKEAIYYTQQEFPDFCSAYTEFFKQSSRGLSLHELCDHPSARTVLCSHDIPIGGLERNVHPSMSKFRWFHTKSLLSLQQKINATALSADSREDILRSKSLHTSQTSRSMARIIAIGDSVHVANMIQEDIRLLNLQASKR